MIKTVRKEDKVCLCKDCGGTGKIIKGVFRQATVCPQCEGSGRVLVKCDMTLDIRPYKEEEK